MGTEVTDLEQMMQTLADASTDPQSVSVGEFAKAVQSLQAELKMLETEVSRLGGSVDNVFNGSSAMPEAPAAVADPADAVDQAVATKP